MTNPYGARLFPHHAELLAASAITPEVATARGYVSVDQKTRLAKLGFASYQQRVPGLLVPLWSTAGAVAGHQYRPDHPRVDAHDRKVKYETPIGGRNVLDAHPRIHHLLGDPSARLWITEGARKADALVSAGEACLALSGVWAWKGTNPHGGKTSLPDWQTVALNGRDVLVVFDSDVMTNPKVQSALDGLEEFLAFMDAKVRLVYLPDGTGGAKVGVDDFIAAGHTVDDVIALAAATRKQVWPEVIPLRRSTRVGPFPIEVLPGWVRSYVRSVAEFTQTPVDLPAMLALAALGVVLAKRVEVEVRRNWVEPLNLFVVVGLATGERKSAVFRLVLNPVEKLQKALVAAWGPVAAEARAKRQVAEAKARAARKAAGEGEDEELVKQAALAEEELATIDVPVPPRLLADDVTQEALASLLAEQDGRIGVFSAEGGIFEIASGRYSEGRPNIEIFLKGYSGDVLRVDRKGRPPEHIDAPALTLGLTVQPTVIEGLQGIRGFRDRGLLARILYALPDSRVGYRSSVPFDIDANIERRYVDAIDALGWLEPALDPWSTDDDATRPHLVRLDAGAHRALVAYQDEIEGELRPKGSLVSYADWANRLPGTVVRLAGLLHMAERGTDGVSAPVVEETVGSAITLARYLTGHAVAAFELMGTDPLVEGAQRILDWADENGIDRFTQREAFNAHQSAFHRVAHLAKVVDLLVEHGHLVREAPAGRSGPGRPPSPTFLVNPLRAKTAQHAEPPPSDAESDDTGGSANKADSAYRGFSDEAEEPSEEAHEDPPEPRTNGAAPDPEAARRTAEAFVAANPRWAARARNAVKGSRTELDDDSVDLRDHPAAQPAADDEWGDL